jgi:tripartite-type tricarboxylate transporter receptor subunit TctC
MEGAMTTTRRLFLQRTTATLLTSGTLTTSAFAQATPALEYPTRNIRSLCNFGPGSGADIVVRFYSDRLSKLAGQPVIVENRPGAAGNIATQIAATA